MSESVDFLPWNIESTILNFDMACDARNGNLDNLVSEKQNQVCSFLESQKTLTTGLTGVSFANVTCCVQAT